jgi:hypothetical protein
MKTTLPRMWARWPAEIVSECALIRAALLPRREVCLYVPNRDCLGQLISVEELVATLRVRIRRINGGQTTFRGCGDYVPPAGAVMDEDTSVIETYLPKVVSDALRDELINLFIAFGCSTRQEVVQVSVLKHAYWIPTGVLLDSAHIELRTTAEGTLRAG